MPPIIIQGTTLPRNNYTKFSSTYHEYHQPWEQRLHRQWLYQGLDEPHVFYSESIVRISDFTNSRCVVSLEEEQETGKRMCLSIALHLLSGRKGKRQTYCGKRIETSRTISALGTRKRGHELTLCSKERKRIMRVHGNIYIGI